MQLAMPSNNTYPAMGAVRQELYINNARRPDLYCLSCSLQSGGQPGTAEIGYVVSGAIAPNLYDAALLRENDAVELKVAGYGTIFRGFIVSRESSVAGSLIYRAVDISQKLNDCFFKEDYGQQDPVVAGVIIYPWTAAQIAARAAQLYTSWRTLASLTDYALTFDLATFPAISAGPQALRGQPLLVGLASMLESIDYRLRIGVKHTNSASTIFAYYLGAGPLRQFIRGLDPSATPESQPSGEANVGNSEKQVNALNTISHVQAEGDSRLVETSFTLTGDWREIADAESVPEGGNVLDYVLAADVETVINNWEKYTTEKIDIRPVTGEVLTVANSNYRRKYVDVCRRWAIPLVNDVFYPDDDTEAELDERGITGRRVPIATDIVQTWQGETLDPFVVYKRTGDANYYAQFDGFTIKDSATVEFQKPFVDTVSRVLEKGSDGAFVPDSYDTGANTSQYVVGDSYVDFTASIPSETITAGAWLYLGEVGTFYKISAVASASTITVMGNLTGAGGENAGGDFVILDLLPLQLAATDGTGETGGKYRIAAGTGGAASNEYAGMYLVLGDYDVTDQGFVAAPADVKCYRIAYNNDKVLFVDDVTEDLTGASANYAIVNPRQETFRRFEAVYLNAAFQSVQKLTYQSTNLSDLRAKRIVHKSNPEYLWRTMANYWKLVAQTGAEDKFVVTYTTTKTDAVKDQAALGTWALQSVGGANIYESDYAMSLPFMELAVQIGDRLVDTGTDSGCSVTGVEHDFTGFQSIVRAASY